MASLATVTPIRAQVPPQVLPPGAYDLQTLDFEMRTAARAHRQSFMRMAFFGYRLRYYLALDWSPLGVANEDEYRRSLGICHATYLRALRIGQRFHQLPLADLEQITPVNADILLAVDPALIPQFDWIGEAKRLNSAQLTNLVVKRNRQVGSDREPKVVLSIRVPATSKLFLEERIEKFRIDNELTSQGEALELMIADMHDRPNALMAVKRAHKYVQFVRFMFMKSRPNAVEEVSWLDRAQQLLDKAVWATRMNDSGELDEEDEETVYAAAGPEGFQDAAEWDGSLSEQPGGEAGEEAEDDEALADAGADMCAVPVGDEFAGCEDGGVQ